MELLHSYKILGNPISVNHAYISVCKGRRVIRFPSKEFKMVKDYVKKYCTKGLKTPIKGELYVFIDFYFGDKRRRDIDNPIKVVFDSANDIIWEDDSQVKGLNVEKHYDKEIPRTEVFIYAI